MCKYFEMVVLLVCLAVPSAPVGVTYVNQSSTSVLISWSPPEIFDGIISTYILSYTRVETNITYFCSTDNSTQYHLDGLEKYELYTVSVTAKTGKGVGVPSEPLVILTDQDGEFILTISNVYTVTVLHTSKNIKYNHFAYLQYP